MFPKIKINESKTSINNSLKKVHSGKPISLIIKTNNFPNNDISKKYYPSNLSKANSMTKTSQNNIKTNKSNKNKNSSIHNLTLHRQETQGSLYSLKNYMNETQITNNNINKNNNLNHKKLNSYTNIGETKTPKLLELINNKIKKKKGYLETYSNINSIKGNNPNFNYNKSQTSLSVAHKKQNLSQANIEHINLDDYYNNNIFKSTRNHKIMNKIVKDNIIDNFHNKTNKNKNKFNRYDRNKCIIERKIYGEEKQIKKNMEKSVVNKTLPNNCEYLYNKNLYNNIKLNINKELNLNNLNHVNKQEKIDSNKTSNNYNLKLNYDIKKNYSPNKLTKSRTNKNILNNSSEKVELNKKNENEINLNDAYSRRSYGKDIKLLFPSVINKSDLNNESSQESTNQVGNTYSNKMTIKDKFISSFINGPEDIHYKFVDLHKQRKIFYENLCNKLEEEGNNLDNNNKTNNNDFDKNEYSEYFDNYDENVPII